MHDTATLLLRSRPRGRPGLRAAFAAGAALVASLSAAAAFAAADADPFGASWPEGEGRELTGAWCGGCHSLDLVRQQGLTRPGWDELLTWMTEKQNMPPLEGEMRDTVLDYLATSFDTGRAPPSADADEGFGTLTPAQGVELPILEIRPAE